MKKNGGEEMKKLDRNFYNRDSITVAKELLGKVLVHETNEQIIKSKIVETESYMGIIDKAAHTYGGKRTPRVEVLYGEAGFSYVYLIYGMYNCFNISCMGKDVPQAVLIRAVEPLSAHEIMAQNRFKTTYSKLTNKQKINLTNGPGKLCSAMKIDRSLNALDLCGDTLYLEDGETDDFSITESTRIGIDYAEEAKIFPWRFYITENEYVSVK